MCNDSYSQNNNHIIQHSSKKDPWEIFEKSDEKVLMGNPCDPVTGEIYSLSSPRTYVSLFQKMHEIQTDIFLPTGQNWYREEHIQKTKVQLVPATKAEEHS